MRLKDRTSRVGIAHNEPMVGLVPHGGDEISRGLTMYTNIMKLTCMPLKQWAIATHSVFD